MIRIERFRSLQDVRTLRLELRSERDSRAMSLRNHWEDLKDKDFRRGLLLNIAADMFRSENSKGTLGTIANGVKLAGGWLPIVGPLLAGRKGILGSRAFWSGLTLLVPLLVKGDGSARMGSIIDLVRSVMDRFRSARHDRESSEEPAV